MLLLFTSALQAEEQEPREQLEIQVQNLRQEAEALEKAGRWKDARDVYQRILIIDPGDFAAKRKVYDLALENANDKTRYFVQQQLMAVEAQAHLIKAERLYEEEKDIQIALDELDRAEALHNRSNTALSQTDLLRLRELRVALFRLRNDFEKAELEKKRLENQERVVVAVERSERQARSIFEQRLSRITDLVRKGFYERALSLTRSLVADYPHDPASDAMFVLVIDLVHKQRKLDYEESIEELKREIRHQMHEALIPMAWDAWPVYADDWEERINSRKLEYVEVETPIWKEALQNKVAERTSVNFEEQDIGDALDFFATRLGVNIVVDPDIRASGAQVTLQARNMSIANILSWLAQQADSQWQYYNEAIYFGAPQEEEVLSRVYDVGQLIYQAPEFPGIELALTSSGTDGAGGGLFDDAGFESDGGIAPEDLIDLIETTVNPSGWEENDDWGIRVRGNMLMVSTSADTHELLREFIRSMRDSNDIVVNIATRWVTISDLFVEEIGVNWLNEGRIDGVTNEAIHSEIPPRADAETDFGINVENVLPGSAVQTANTIINRGLRLDFAIIDAIQAVAIWEAVQFKEKGRVLEQIDLSVHNGARANAFAGRSLAYIRDYDVVTGSNGGGSISALDPQIGIVNTGAALDIQPFVSSDHKYVTLDLKPSFTTVSFDIANLVALQPLVGFPTAQLLPIELPVVRSKVVRTRVMIPDRGTLLAGGFGEHIEQNSYAQIPVLGNLPFIGRLFSRRAIRESRSSLYLMVTAKIIMYSELETLQ